LAMKLIFFQNCVPHPGTYTKFNRKLGHIHIRIFFFPKSTDEPFPFSYQPKSSGEF
jgi:hypothetical protein